MNLDELKHQILHPEDETYFFQPDDIQANKAAGILASIPALFWIPLVIAKDSAYGKFCANQGLILFALNTVIGIVSHVVFPILGLIPFLGGIAIFVLRLLCLAVSAGSFLLLMVSAIQGKARRIPLIGRLFDAFH